MKQALLLIAAVFNTLAASAAESEPEFKLFDQATMSQQWKPNPALWRELTTTRTNPAIAVGSTEFRMSGPLVNAYQKSRKNAGERPSLGKTLISIPVGVLSLFVPQPMPRPPESGGKYFVWKGEHPQAWGTQMGAAADSDGFFCFGW